MSNEHENTTRTVINSFEDFNAVMESYHLGLAILTSLPLTELSESFEHVSKSGLLNASTIPGIKQWTAQESKAMSIVVQAMSDVRNALRGDLS